MSYSAHTVETPTWLRNWFAFTADHRCIPITAVLRSSPPPPDDEELDSLDVSSLRITRNQDLLARDGVYNRVVPISRCLLQIRCARRSDNSQANWIIGSLMTCTYTWLPCVTGNPSDSDLIRAKPGELTRAK